MGFSKYSPRTWSQTPAAEAASGAGSRRTECLGAVLRAANEHEDLVLELRALCKTSDGRAILRE